MTAWYFNGTLDYEIFFNGNLNYEIKIYGKHFYALYFYCLQLIVEVMLQITKFSRCRSMAPYFNEI